MNGPSKPTNLDDGLIDDAALNQVDGGRGTPTAAVPHVSWADLLTDPNQAVPFDPAPLTTTTGHAPDDAKPTTTPTVYANW